MALKMLKLPEQAARGKIEESISQYINVVPDSLTLWWQIGKVKCLIFQKPRRLVVNKTVQDEVAVELAKLGRSDVLVTFEQVFKNAAILYSFSTAISLEEILSVRQGYSFKPQHGLLLAKDILDGVSSLKTAHLKRGSFNEGHVLLVERKGAYFFQIAGLEDCTYTGDNEPDMREEYMSCRNVLFYLQDITKDTILNKHIKNLGAGRRSEIDLKREAKLEQDYPIYRFREELRGYFDAFRILGTVNGGKAQGLRATERR